STESHATGPDPAACAASSASSVVLPKPAGADTSVTGVTITRASRSLSRGRGTNPRWTPGANSLVSSRWLVIVPIASSRTAEARASGSEAELVDGPSRELAADGEPGRG